MRDTHGAVWKEFLKNWDKYYTPPGQPSDEAFGKRIKKYQHMLWYKEHTFSFMP